MRKSWVLFVMALAIPAFAVADCFEIPVAVNVMEIEKSPKAADVYKNRSGSSADSQSNHSANRSSSTYKVAKGLDNYSRLDSHTKLIQKTLETDWNGVDCIAVRANLVTVSWYYPALWGVCGPAAQLDAGITTGVTWKYGSGHWRLMPVQYMYTEAGVNLQCGYPCFRIWGGLGSEFRYGVDSPSYYYQENYVSLDVGPRAGAEIFCASVWGWSENWYSGRKVLYRRYI